VTFAWLLLTGVVSAAVLAAFDRWIKHLVVSYPARGGVILSGWLQWRPAANPSLALGIPFPAGGAAVLAAIVIPVLAWWWLALARRRDGLAVVAVAWIIAGAASNLADRLRWGYVVDYLDVPWFTVFNLADAMITFGVALLIGRELVQWRTLKSRVSSS
jgi:signal peptidase II